MFVVPCNVNLCYSYSKTTRCKCSQTILFYCRITQHIWGVVHTHHRECIKLYLQPQVQVILSLQLPASNVATWPRWRKVAATIIWPVTKAVVTVLCTPDDGCGQHPKHVEWSYSKIILTANSCISLVYCNVTQFQCKWSSLLLFCAHFISVFLTLYPSLCRLDVICLHQLKCLLSFSQ
jgi:hypothetical protein